MRRGILRGEGWKSAFQVSRHENLTMKETMKIARGFQWVLWNAETNLAHSEHARGQGLVTLVVCENLSME